MLPHHRLVVGYHGCDASLAEDVLLRRKNLEPSRNPYDWLGAGVYFWEHSQRRAYQFACEQRERPGPTPKVRKPAVLGAYISLGRCFDLTDTDVTGQLRKFYLDYKQTMKDAGLPMKRNKRSANGDLLLRYLDSDVLNLGLANLDVAAGGGEGSSYQTVRGVFVEGKPAYPFAAIRVKTHVQIAVRDPACILGYFMPSGYDEEEALP